VLSVHAAVKSYALIQVNKHELVAHLGIPFRDLRILDPSVRLHHVKALLLVPYSVFDMEFFWLLNELSGAGQTLIESLLYLHSHLVLDELSDAAQLLNNCCCSRSPRPRHHQFSLGSPP
jgi:hypothetical protein